MVDRSTGLHERKSQERDGQATETTRPPAAALILRRLIRQGNGSGIDTSVGLLFNHTLWGRDRALTALDVLPYLPLVARDSIIALARLQGVRSDRHTEEEPGRIHSEQRDLRSWRAPMYLRRLFEYLLAPAWGGDHNGYTTYFSSDSTPLYVTLVDEYAKLDPSILDEGYRRRDGRRATIRDSVMYALIWIRSHVTADGLVEVPRQNPVSLPHQVWRDGPTSNFDVHGRMPNVLEPVAWLDVQVLCVEALRRGAWLLRAAAPLPEDGRLPDETLRMLAEAELMEDEARQIRDATLRDFWMPARRYFGYAMDRGPDGRRRLLSATQSNAGWVLASGLLDDLPEEERRVYIEGIVRTLFSADLLTDAGLRGRALADSNPRFRNYHENVWPVDTFMTAKGLRRQGFDELAEQLEARLLNVMNALGSYYEFIVVDDDGSIIDPTEAVPLLTRLLNPGLGLPSEMVPDRDLAWSVTAAWRIKRERARRAREGRRLPEATGGWIAALTADVLAEAPLVTVARSREQARAAIRLSKRHLSHVRGLAYSAGTVLVQGGPMLLRKYVSG